MLDLVITGATIYPGDAPPFDGDEERVEVQTTEAGGGH